METFVVCHNQEIIRHCEESGRFKILPQYRYLFVGNGTCDNIRNMSNVIICKDLTDNIEQHKFLMSFTAWYAVVRNNLADNESIALLEYDSDISGSFHRDTINALKSDCIAGYTRFPLLHPDYMEEVVRLQQEYSADEVLRLAREGKLSFLNALFSEATPLFAKSLREVYGIDVIELVFRHFRTGGDLNWCATSNAAMHLKTLKDFVEWYMPLAQAVRHDPLGAHVHERCIKIYSILKGIPQKYISNALVHRQLKSHHIEALV